MMNKRMEPTFGREREGRLNALDTTIRSYLIRAARCLRISEAHMPVKRIGNVLRDLATIPSALLAVESQVDCTDRKGAERVVLAGLYIDLIDHVGVLRAILERLTAKETAATVPLAVVSADLDHIRHFGRGGDWAGALTCPSKSGGSVSKSGGSVEWMTLLDGAPLISQAERLSGHPWPRLAGRDLITPLLDALEERMFAFNSNRVGFLSRESSAQELLAEKLRQDRPDLFIGGLWFADSPTAADPVACRTIAGEIADAGVDLLIVELEKPLQELWIAEYGPLTGAKVLLAAGPADLLVGSERKHAVDAPSDVVITAT